MEQARLRVEVCVSSLADAELAIAAGVDRLELCSVLELGGVTPSQGLLEEVLLQTTIPVVVMIRPRIGGFCYSGDEFRVTLKDARQALDCGAAGIVCGILTADRQVDRARCRELVDLAKGKQVVFHRAFDFVADPIRSAEELAELGFQRVLTSGQAATAIAGASLIKKLINRFSGRLEILPGGGIRAENVMALIKQTGCEQVHLGVSHIVDDGSIAAEHQVSLCATRPLPHGSHQRTNAALLSNFMDIVLKKS